MFSTAPGAARSAAALVLACAAVAVLASGGCGSAGAAPPIAGTFDKARAWQNLETIVEFGPRPAGSAELESLRSWIESELTSYGLAPVRESFGVEDTPIGAVQFANVYVDVPGTPTEDGAPPPIVVLCTHFDTKRMPFHFVGANDGGSGTAVLLEIARILAKQDVARPVTYRLLFLDGEEAIVKWEGDDNTYGSRYHVAQMKQDRALFQRVVACVLLDMVGDKDLRLNRESLSDYQLLEIFFATARGNNLGEYVSGPPMEVRDDHLSFMSADIRSCNLIDFDYENYWHTAEDTLDKLSADSLYRVGRIVLWSLPALEHWALRQYESKRR